MPRASRFLLALPLFLAAECFGADYQHGPDSARQSGVPRGKVTEHVWQSGIFPDALRWLWRDWNERKE